MASASHISPLEAYISPDELADELVLQKTLLYTLDNTTKGSEQAEADIKAEIARIETQLRALRGGVTGPHIGASVLGRDIPQQQQHTNNFGSASPFSNYNPTSTDPFSCELFCIFPHRKYPSHHFLPFISEPQLNSHSFTPLSSQIQLTMPYSRHNGHLSPALRLGSWVYSNQRFKCKLQPTI